MRGVKYTLSFIQPDGQAITLNNLKSADVQDHIQELLRTHYNYEYLPTRNFVHNLHSRPTNVNRFVRSRVSISKVQSDTTEINQATVS